MQERTQVLWNQQDRHPGDRLRLFRSIAAAIDAAAVLYPGSFVDVAPSFVFDDVTYVDVDRRANRFFSDAAGVDELIAAHRTKPSPARWRFLHQDYTGDLGLGDGSCDLLVSMYAGFVSAGCMRYLAPGGHLLVNPSHGDAALASLDDRLRLVGVVHSRSGDYRVTDRDLETYLQPKRGTPITREEILELGRGVGFTKSAFAYLFARVDL